MATVKELRELVAKCVTQAREAVDQIDDKTEEARAKELNDQADRALEEARDLESKIERLEKIEASERKVEEAREREERARRPGGGDGAAPAIAEDGDAPDYRQAFHEYLRCQGQVGAMRPEARAVLDRGYRKIEVSEERAQTAGTDSAGGYTVPEELQQILIRSMKAHGPMYDGDIVQEIVTESGAGFTMPTVDDTAVTAGAHTEGATLTDDGGKDATFGEKRLDAFEYDTEWVRVSRALADDSIFAMEQLLGDLLGERLARIANSKLTVGTGSSEPNGVSTASAEGKVAAANNAITTDEIIDLIHSVDPAYRNAPGVRVHLHDTTLKAIRKLKDGDGNYLWQMGNIQQGVPGTILGYNYDINQDLAELTDGVDSRVMLFGDFKKYFVRKVGQPLIGAIQDKDFWPGFGVAGYIRFDGELADTAALKHLALAAA